MSLLDCQVAIFPEISLQTYVCIYVCVRAYVYVNVCVCVYTYTVIPRLTSDTANDFFG